MPQFDAYIVPVVIVLALVLALFWALALWRGRRLSGSTHALSRDNTVNYFPDFSGTDQAPGVREEDRTGRWGGGNGEPR